MVDCREIELRVEAGKRYTLTQLAKISGLHRRTLRRWVKESTKERPIGPRFHKGRHSRVSYLGADILNWLRSQIELAERRQEFFERQDAQDRLRLYAGSEQKKAGDPF